jgi:acyl carrier protein
VLLSVVPVDYIMSRMDALTRIRELAAKEFSIDPAGLDPNTPLQTLKIDSLSFAEFLFKLEDEFGVSLDEEALKNVKTLADLEQCIASAVSAAGRV